MSMVFASLGMSLDGFIAGPNAGPDNALGDGGGRIHRWLYAVEAWRERQALSGGERNPDAELVEENYNRAGAYVMGRRMFDEGEVAWPDPPPFRAPVFVLTHQPREPWERQGGMSFTFVTDGVESALAKARSAAGEKDVQVAGGAEAVAQFLNAGLLDELEIHIAPVLLGAGTRLFERVQAEKVKLKPTRVVESPAADPVARAPAPAPAARARPAPRRRCGRSCTRAVPTPSPSAHRRSRPAGRRARADRARTARRSSTRSRRGPARPAERRARLDAADHQHPAE
jgi:dihydrofolate reductase